MRRTRRSFLAESATALAIRGAPARATDTFPRRARNDEESFDFIVIGAGSAGSVLAKRLSQDTAHRVLVLEAGGAGNQALISDLGRWTSLAGTDADWNYATEPENGLLNRVIRWPRGRALGGSSAISAAAYVRGHASDFDFWAEETGDARWTFANALPLFRASENNERGASHFHGDQGEMHVSDTRDPNRAHAAFLEAARSLGFGADPEFDFSGIKQDGTAGFYQKTLRNGRRHSAADAFLKPALRRTNLIVRPHSLVLSLRFEGSRVIGATYIEASASSGEPRHVRATREVVLCAGAVESPKLLMLSGVGPADHLRSLGIPVRASLRGVGANLHDHPRIPFRWTARTPIEGSSVSAGLFTHSQAPGDADAPDLQFYAGRGLSAAESTLSFSIALSRPRSRGEIRLRSSDVAAPPAIRAAYFRDERDQAAAVAAVRLGRAFSAARAYDALRGDALDELPGSDSAAESLAYARRTAGTIYHPGGTCRMGRGDDAVVDPGLRVLGVSGLRVADASVMPRVVNAQTHAACVMIAEQASASILQASRG